MRNGISARNGTPGTRSRRDEGGSTVAERHSFLVVEETLGAQTIAEYRRSRAARRRPTWRTRLLGALRLRAGGRATPPPVI